MLNKLFPPKSEIELLIDASIRASKIMAKVSKGNIIEVVFTDGFLSSVNSQRLTSRAADGANVSAESDSVDGTPRR
jgi:L-aminopeptidase/D-esterase-like protein